MGGDWNCVQWYMVGFAISTFKSSGSAKSQLSFIYNSIYAEARFLENHVLKCD